MGTGWNGYLLEKKLRMIHCKTCGADLHSGGLGCWRCRGSSEYRASRIKDLDVDGFEKLAHDRLDWLEKAGASAQRTALAVEGEAFAREFHGWTSAPPEPAVRLARVATFSTWCSKVSGAIK